MLQDFYLKHISVERSKTQVTAFQIYMRHKRAVKGYQIRLAIEEITKEYED